MGVLFELTEKPQPFPQNKIVLRDGSMLDCYPRNIDDNKNEIDCQNKRDNQEKEDQFVYNAFYLLAHKDRILSDSRMFLCPIPIRNGMAYTGSWGYDSPTLGVYIEWWEEVKTTTITDKKGRRSLVFHLAGSPLSGGNHCAAVREDGKIKFVSLACFSKHWVPFVKNNVRYDDAKQRYQAYTLEEVLDILDKEDESNALYNNK